MSSDSPIVYSTASEQFDEIDPAGDLTPVADVSLTRALRLSETALNERARGGDVEAFASLAREHEAELFRLAFRMLADRDEAQDVVTTTLLEGWRRLPSSPSSVSFRIWMARTAVRHCLVTLGHRTPGEQASNRSVGSDSTSPDSTSPDSPKPASPKPGSETGIPDLDVALTVLVPKDRVCWVLKDLHGLSDRDISYAMGVSEQYVREHVSEARLRLVQSIAA